MLMKSDKFVKKLKTVIPELPENLKSFELSVTQNAGVIVKCEFYVSEDKEDANQPNSSN